MVVALLSFSWVSVSPGKRLADQVLMREAPMPLENVRVDSQESS